MATAFTYYGTCTLPDGRKIEAWESGYTENDTNAFVQTGIGGTWTDTDLELTDEELNIDLGSHFLHEYISDKTEWSN